MSEVWLKAVDMSVQWKSVLLIVFLCFCRPLVCARFHGCPGLPDVLWGAPGQVEAETTGAIKFKPMLLYQNYESECHAEGTQEYRTIDGTCNHVLNLGSANTPLKRMLLPEYDDGYNAPRCRGVHGEALPSPTDISRMIHTQSHTNDFSSRSIMLMQWGQFVDHDITLSPVSLPEGSSPGTEQHHCCRSGGRFPDAGIRYQNGICFPIRKHEGDIRFRGTCMEFSRSIPAQNPSGQKMVPREQLNAVTSFIDGSQIYGSSEETLRQIRSHSRSIFLKFNYSSGLLPKSKDESCLHRPGEYCFLAGDIRVNEQPGLATMHTIMVKLHNRIAWRLWVYTGHNRTYYDSNTVFQLTRKLLVAIMQNIHYKEWLPLIVGEAAMHSYNLYPGKRVSYSGSVDPRIINAFSTAAFRFGHSTIPKQFNISGRMWSLREVFNRPGLLFKDFSAVVTALMDPSTPAERVDRHIVREVTGHLFEPDYHIPDAGRRGLDLAALNIQRGRDHGLPPYNKYRKICGLEPVQSFKQFGPETADYLARLYVSVEDIDLFTGGLLEDPVQTGTVGATFACIISQQFQALKLGDRFYFETDRQPEGFTDAQLDNIRNVTLARVLCFFSDYFKEVQPRCFESPSVNNQKQNCSELHKDLLNWALFAP